MATWQNLTYTNLKIMMWNHKNVEHCHYHWFSSVKFLLKSPKFKVITVVIKIETLILKILSVVTCKSGNFLLPTADMWRQIRLTKCLPSLFSHLSCRYTLTFQLSCVTKTEFLLTISSRQIMTIKKNIN